MKNEINRDYYCSTAGMEDCPEKGNCSGCPDCHRKWPTHEHFKEEYGEWWKGAEYVICDTKADGCNPCKHCGRGGCHFKYWNLIDNNWDYEKPQCDLFFPIYICASTPYGKPDNCWKPK
jgi:hypothetical protein